MQLFDPDLVNLPAPQNLPSWWDSDDEDWADGWAEADKEPEKKDKKKKKKLDKEEQAELHKEDKGVEGIVQVPGEPRIELIESSGDAVVALPSSVTLQ